MKQFLASLIQSARRRFHVPAIAVSVMNSEAVLFQEIQGTRVAGGEDAATLDDFFHIGSCSKSVLAVIAARSVEEGRIAWSTRFFEVFPQLEKAAHPGYRAVTLEDLFLCRAGIKPYTNFDEDPVPSLGPPGSDSLRRFAEFLVAQAPSSRQRDGRFEHLYSNASYTMIACVLEKVSGQPYESLVAEMLRDGPGLASRIGWPNRLSASQPWGHLIQGCEVEPYAPDHPYAIPHLLTPAGDLSMTVRDYAAYTRMHLRGLSAGDRYLSRDSYQRIHFGHAGFSLAIANGSLGGIRFSGLDGSAGTFFCRSVIVPDRDFALSVMANAGSGGPSMKAVDYLTIQLAKKQFGWWWKFWL